MPSKYFDKWEFSKAHSSTKNNPLETRLKYEEYLKKYPKDYTAMSFYSGILITLEELEKAEQVLNFAINGVKNNKYFINEYNKIEHLNKAFFYTKLRLLSYQEKYEELHQLYLDNLGRYQDITGHVSFYCRKKIGDLDPKRRDKNSYLFRQIVEYQENDFLIHIQRHLADYNTKQDKPNKTIFSPDFPIFEIIEEVKKYLLSSKRLCPGFFDNIYVFKYNECGKDNNKLTNYFKVICFHNTKDIITLFPAYKCENLPYVDLNYLINEDKDEDIKIKKLNQIDKFNKKYKRN